MTESANILKTHSKKIHLSAWLIYSLITFFAVLNHEPNRDEAQVWLIVRDLDISSIYYELSAMGHPGIWYLILLPFAKLGFPYVTMLIIHWLIGISAAGILLFRSHLNTLFKVLFLFSYYLLFEYIVPARNYNLTILFLFLIAANYQTRFSHPLRYAFFVFALFNSNTHSFGAALALLLIYVWDGSLLGKLKNSRTAILLMLAGLALFIFQMWPSLDVVSRNVTIHSGLIPAFSFDSFWVSITAIQNAFIPVTPEYEEIKIALFFTLIFIFFLITLFRTPAVLVFLFLSSAWLFYLFSTKLSGSWRHEGLLLIFIVFSIWISSFYEKKNNFLISRLSFLFNLESFSLFFTKFLCCCFLITLFFGVRSISKEIRYSYSGAEEAAAFLKENKIQEIAAYPSWRATPLSPYIPETKIWQLERNEYGRAYDLDSVFYKYGNSLSDLKILELCRKKYPEECVLMLNQPLNYCYAGQATLIFSNKKFIWGSDDESYFIYTVHFKTH